MSAIAQYLAWEGLAVGGSDRLGSADETREAREKLEACGCLLFPQDGSGVTASTEGLVVSTAIEGDNPDVAAARSRGIPVLHRSDVLAAIVASRRTIAVCGTSGKSTVTALVFEILRACGRSPSVITGANLLRLNEEGWLGNAFRGCSDLLVIEADESDGTLVKYHPEKAVFLNLSKDHQPVDQTLELFRQLAGRTSLVIKNGDDPGLDSLPAARRFGLSAGADCRPEAVAAVTPGVRFTLQWTDFELPLPGRHNLSNALAALCVCLDEGCSPEQIAGPMRSFKGIARRFALFRTPKGVTVIDDYAHNPDKIRAALLTARDFGERIFAVFQPHGYGPTRFLKDELIETFARFIRNTDEVYFLPIYYPGGTAKKDISSEDLAGAVALRGVASHASPNRRELIAALARRVQPGDAVILMGARDPSLAQLSREIRDGL